jgi:23S rRNA pseudouridine2604 synthase
MAGGIYIEELGKRTKKCKVKKLDKYTFSIILTQGLNRQIRRMCDYLNYDVKTLKRVRIMNIWLDTPLGKYRELTKKEFDTLSELISDSKKTFDPKQHHHRKNRR